MMDFKYFLLPVVMCLSSYTAKLLASNKNKKPNLVFVFADQLRSDVFGYTGDNKAKTPNIDKFAGGSFNFCNAISVSPVSAPMRSSLLTGKYISSTVMVINELNLNLDHKTIAHVLNENGYNCGYVGKMHLNDKHSRNYKKGPERFGFDHYWAGYSFSHNSYRAFYYTDDDGKEYHVNLTGKYGPEEFTTLACKYIERASSEDKPFVLFLSWNPPHNPWNRKNVPQENYDKFKDTRFDLPPNFR